ncbi:unnamed protein product [Blepharisma stoltei]|uniref:Uncharacterized protein n=1 Tax=Blepharisma stoltei TaxID=1481888 RepID=A0AAU9J243_9CILI|nr:unnamed protein product [Blepharisma stoltei]
MSKSRHLLKEKASTVRTSNEPTYSSVEELETKIADLQKELESAEEQTKKVSEINLKKLDHLVKREHEYRTTMSQYEDQLQGRIWNKQVQLNPLTLQNLEKINKFHKDINDKIGIVQYKTTQIMIDKERDIVKDYNSKFTNIESELNNQKSTNIIKIDTAEKKEKQLLKRRENLQKKMVNLEKNHQKLIMENQALKLDMKDQENDIENQKFELELLHVTNLQLKRDLRHFSSEMVDLKKVTPLSTERSRPPQHFASTGNLINNSYDTDIASLKVKIKKEQENNRRVKNELIQLLESKKELKTFLRQCIDDVKDKITQHLTNIKLNQSPLTEEQQEKLMELLLSQERVLTLLHDKAFPQQNGSQKLSGSKEAEMKNNIVGIEGTMERIDKVYDHYENILKSDSIHFKNKRKQILNNKFYA